MTDQPTNDQTARELRRRGYALASAIVNYRAWRGGSDIHIRELDKQMDQALETWDEGVIRHKNAFGHALYKFHASLSDEDKADLDQMIKDAEADENHSRQATQPEPALDPALRNINITICQSCLDGKGEECHTPGCALYLHRVDLPIAPELYTILPDSPTDEQIFEDLALCEAATPEPWDNVGIRHYATGETRLSLSERLTCTVMASQADYDFIARARTALKAAVEALQAAT
ncbi:MAG TPA: hypothetical protein PLK67_00340 [Bryobacteraceae bacterium]|nr:hypothetical protein [Bryobacteraceae bacterium]